MNREDDIHQFTQYLERRFPDRRTAIDYTSDVRQFAAASPKPWREVTMHDIDAFVDQQRQSGLSPATVKRRVATLKTLFDFLAEETGDLSWPNPVRFKRHAGKQPRRLPRDLSDETVERLWAVLPSARDRAWFVLLLRAGLRVGEVVGLTMADLLAPATTDQPARLRVCGKGRQERLVLLTADAATVLTEWLAERPPSDHAHLFLNERGQPLTVSGLEWLLGQYAAQAGVTATPHQLRHTFARQLTEAGMPITSLGKLLGHADLSTTQVYTAGADPALCHAYQTAMERLASAPLLPSPPPVVPAAPAPPPPQPTASPSLAADPLPEPVWDTWAPDLPTPIRQACLAFVQRRRPTWKPQRRDTRAGKVLGELRRFWTWQLGHRPVSQPGAVTLKDLQAYQAARGAAGQQSGTINYTLSEVLALLRGLADAGQPVDASVFRLRPLPRPEALPRHLTEADHQRLEAYVQARLDAPGPLTRLENACFFVLAHTGLRASECTDLLGQDLDLTSGRLVVRQGKGQRDRVVYLSPTTSVALNRYRGDTPCPPTAPLFSRVAGRPISYAWRYEHMTALGAAAGVPEVTPHRLRHTLATRLLNAGMDITRIQKLLGHEHVNTTMIYARVHDATVEADYRQAMREIERRHMPLSDTPMPAAGWPTEVKQAVPLDNSV